VPFGASVGRIHGGGLLRFGTVIPLFSKFIITCPTNIKYKGVNYMQLGGAFD
jgi:hypothetical protein